MKKHFVLSLLLFLFAAPAVSAAVQNGVDTQDNDSQVSVFKNMMVLPKATIVVPTVLEVSLANTDIETKGFLVKENETGVFVPSSFKDTSVQINETLTVQSVAGEKSRFMVDGNFASAVSFPILHNGPEETDIRIDSKNAITTSQLVLTLPPNVTLPRSVAITARDAEGTYQTVVAKRPVSSTVINFPETISDSWRVTFEYEQPLRIAELSFTQSDAQIQENQSLRFLAQPQYTYTVFFNPDQSFVAPDTESGNLQNNTGVRKVAAGVAMRNPEYIAADVDGDGVEDVIDNCPRTANPDQADIDENGTGDVCDDYDRDSVLNTDDNCPNQPNYNQADEDGDGVGDVCDGVESRLTERYTWVPWVGMGIALLVLVALFAIVGLKPKDTQVDV